MAKSIKVMELIDPNKGTMRCKICGSEHDASIKPNSGGQYHYGSWQCTYKCQPGFNGFLKKNI